MIIYNSETKFVLANKDSTSKWIKGCIAKEGYKEGELNYIFCDDEYLSKLNYKHLKHNTLTDVISFDYTLGRLISGDIFISIERIKENALEFKTSFKNELNRVMVHGILHYCGYNDKTKEEKELMRSKEDYYLSLRTF